MRLVWFSEIRWDYLKTRKQQILTRFPKNWRVLFIEPCVIGKRAHWFPSYRENIIVITIPFLRGISGGLLQKIVYKTFIKSLVNLIGVVWLKLVLFILGFTNSDRVIGLSSVHWGKVASRMKASLRFYDCNDNHLAFGNPPPWAAKNLRAYLNVADVAFYVSPELDEFIKDYGNLDTHYLSNGVEYEHFSSSTFLPEDLADLKRPIIGYAGTMNWLDPELLKKVAIRFSNYNIVLIGPSYTYDWRKSHSDLTQLPNVYYLGKKDYSILPAYIQRFRVAMIPFVCNDLTSSLNPNKLYEYCAAGCPVVSMNYSSTLNKTKHLVNVADNDIEFLDYIDLALKDNMKTERQSFARDYDWAVITNKMLDIINGKISSFSKEEQT